MARKTIEKKTCPECGKEGLKGQRGLSLHMIFAHGEEPQGAARPSRARATTTEPEADSTPAAPPPEGDRVPDDSVGFW